MNNMKPATTALEQFILNVLSAVFQPVILFAFGLLGGLLLSALFGKIIIEWFNNFGITITKSFIPAGIGLLTLVSAYIIKPMPPTIIPKDK